MTPEEFSQRFVDLLRERIPDSEATIDEPLSVSVKLPDDLGLHCSLGNAFLAYENGEDPNEAIEAYIGAIVEALDAQKSPPDADKIIPTVRTREYLDSIQVEGKDLPIHHHLAGDLWVVYAFDLPTFTQGLMPADLERLGIDEQKVKELALENLPAHVEQPELHWLAAGGMITAGGYHEASLLLVRELWDEIAKELPGEIIATVPARDTLAFTSIEIERGVARTLDAAMTIVAGGDHVNSATLLRRTATGWEVYEALAERALLEAIHEVIALLLEGDEARARARLGEVSDKDLAVELLYDAADDLATEEEEPAAVVRMCNAALALSPTDPDLKEALETLRTNATA